MEPYLTCIKHEGKSVLLFKLRSGIASLRIETGRYESNVDLYLLTIIKASKKRDTGRVPYMPVLFWRCRARITFPA